MWDPEKVFLTPAWAPNARNASNQRQRKTAKAEVVQELQATGFRANPKPRTVREKIPFSTDSPRAEIIDHVSCSLRVEP